MHSANSHTAIHTFRVLRVFRGSNSKHQTSNCPLTPHPPNLQIHQPPIPHPHSLSTLYTFYTAKPETRDPKPETRNQKL